MIKGMQGTRSPIELMYDDLVVAEKLKRGTKYERLAAIIFTVLVGHDNVVTHDVKLVGSGKETQHQIDVLIQKSGSTMERILVECKDYESKVGLSIVRDFKGVCVQLQPHRAIVVTSCGFTKPALTYCGEEHIEPLLLRPFEDKDWEGRVQSVELILNINVVATVVLEWLMPEDETHRFQECVSTNGGQQVRLDGQELYAADGGFVGMLAEPIAPYLDRIRWRGDEVEQTVTFDHPLHLSLFGEHFETTGLVAGMATREGTPIKSVITKDDFGQAVVLVQTVLNDELNKAIFDREIRKFQIATNRQVLIR